jgi:hypothetical protein
VLSKIREAGLKPPTEIVRYFDIEADAFELEIELIAKHGRRDLSKGTLCNLTDGGEGAAGGLAQAARGREWMRKLNADPEFKKAKAERARRLQADPVFSAAHAERMRQRNADPEYRARIAAGRADPANIRSHAERLQKLNDDPEFKKANAERGRERMRKLHADPEFRARLAAGHAAYYARQRAGYQRQPSRQPMTGP